MKRGAAAGGNQIDATRDSAERAAMTNRRDSSQPARPPCVMRRLQELMSICMSSICGGNKVDGDDQGEELQMTVQIRVLYCTVL